MPIYRESGTGGTIKHAELTIEDGDANTQEWYDRITALEDLDVGRGVSDITIFNNVLSFHMSDSTTEDVTIPPVAWKWKGLFAAISFSPMDLFYVGRSVYEVMVAHTGELPFDAGRTGPDGDYYNKVFDFPPLPGFEISDTEFTPDLTHSDCWMVLTGNNCDVTIDPSLAWKDWVELHFRDETDNGATFNILSTTLAPAVINPQYSCLNESMGKGSTMTLKKRGATRNWDIFGLLQTTE